MVSSSFGPAEAVMVNAKPSLGTHWEHFTSVLFFFLYSKPRVLFLPYKAKRVGFPGVKFMKEWTLSPRPGPGGDCGLPSRLVLSLRLLVIHRTVVSLWETDINTTFISQTILYAATHPV